MPGIRFAAGMHVSRRLRRAGHPLARAGKKHFYRERMVGTMRFVIVTGMSGAGKSTALKMLEDIGYFCVDNLPILLMPKFAEMMMTPDAEINQVALGIDVRSGQAP